MTFLKTGKDDTVNAALEMHILPARRSSYLDHAMLANMPRSLREIYASYKDRLSARLTKLNYICEALSIPNTLFARSLICNNNMYQSLRPGVVSTAVSFVRFFSLVKWCRKVIFLWTINHKSVVLAVRQKINNTIALMVHPKTVLSMVVYVPDSK